MNDSAIELTHITKADVDSGRVLAQLQDLSNQWQFNEEFWTLESCLDSIRNQPGILCASATLIPDAKWSGWYLASCHENDAELLFIFTTENQRGKGVARALLDDLIERINRIAETVTLSLEVRPSNTPAIGLYESKGFKFISRRKNYYKNGEDALVYQLNIHP
jgi:ribosomal-protein-alanine N-acetyltransferase